MLPIKKKVKPITLVAIALFIILLFIAFSKDTSQTTLVSKKQKSNGIFTKYEYTLDKTIYDSGDDIILIGESSSKWIQSDGEKDNIVKASSFKLAPEYTNFIPIKSFSGNEMLKLKLDPCLFKAATFGKIKVERFKVEEISKISKKVKNTSFENIITITPDSIRVIFKDNDGKTWFKNGESAKAWCETIILPKDIETTSDPLDLSKITYVSKMD